MKMLRIAAALLIAGTSTAALAYHHGDHSDAKKTAYDNKEKSTQNIVETAVSAGQFTTLASLLQQAELVDALQGDGPFTVFAPTDEAFSKVPQQTLAALGNNPEQLKQVLLYHVVSGKVKSKQITETLSPETLQGTELTVTPKDGKVMVNNANVIKADVYASNGVIHVIDTVLIPGTDGGQKAAKAGYGDSKTIAEIAAGNEDFSTLVSLLSQAGLVDALKGEGPFTVFAPTNDAFAKVPAATLQQLAANPDQLKSVLLYHVVPAKVKSTDITGTLTPKTLQGQQVTVKPGQGTVMVGEAKVTKADIMASNGVIHVVDSVILPPTDVSAAAGY